MELREKKRFVYEFGRFVLDPDEKTLLVDGARIHLPAKEFETLLLLVENNGKALSKEQMMSAVWQDAFVEEGNLAKQVSKLRKLLNTNGERFIETLPKHGYRFSADLRLKEPDDADPVIIEKRTVRRMTVAFPGEPDHDRPSEPIPLLPGAAPRFRPTFRVVMAIGIFLASVGAILFYFWPQGTARTAPIKSLAVLPFKSVGTQSDDEILRLGLADALITKLSNLKQIVVRPTSAVRKYGNHEPVSAGRELGVDAVLDASVQRDGQTVRVSVQVIDVRDGRPLWGRTFDETYTDVFRVQDKISEQVAGAIAPGLSGEESTLLAKRYTINSEAHHAYVKGRVFWNRRTGEDLEQALGYFEEAVRKDPSYALAYVGLADTYSLLADYKKAAPADSYQKARDAALKALELDEGLAEAHTSLAYVRMYYYWDWTGAENSYRRAIALNPNYGTARQWYSEYLTAKGKFDDALVEIRRAKEIDPLSPVINAGEVWILYFARRYDEAIRQGEAIVEMNPEFAEIHEYLKRCYDQTGQYQEAIESRQLRRKLAGYDPNYTAALRAASAARNSRDYWNRRLAQELDDERREGAASFDMAEIYSQLGDRDRAFGWLEKAYNERTYTMIYIQVAPNLDNLRADPRYADIVRRVGL